MDSSKLKEILDQHQLWIDGKGGSRADLTGANLYYADLRDANLTGANLGYANLGGANLERANLERANLKDAYLVGANLSGANLSGANLQGAHLNRANLTNTILPDVSWIIPGCLAQLNEIKYGFYLVKEIKLDNFVQDSIGFFIQNNPEEGTFDMLVEDRIIRNIPEWVKYSGLSQTEK